MEGDSASNGHVTADMGVSDGMTKGDENCHVHHRDRPPEAEPSTCVCNMFWPVETFVSFISMNLLLVKGAGWVALELEVLDYMMYNTDIGHVRVSCVQGME